MLGSLDPAKILVILVIALIVLGPERLPRAARQLGAAWRELTRVREQVTEEVRSAIPDLGLPDVPRFRPGAVSGFLSDLTRSDAREGSGAAGAGLDGAAAPGGGDLAGGGAPGDRGGDRGGAAGGAGVADGAGTRGVGTRRVPVAADQVLGDFSFPLDDPGMN